MHRRVPELAGLELVDAVARTGSMSAAGREFLITQQAVSTKIRAIERQLGVELFVRSPQGARLTSDGESVVAWAREVLAAAERMGAAIDLLHAAPERTLAVGGSQTIAARLLPGWMLRLRERQIEAAQHPTAVRLLTGNSTEIARFVREGALDLGFIETPRLPADLASTTVAADRLVAVVPPDHTWGGTIGLAELAATPLVVRESGSGTRSAFELAVVDRLGAEPAEAALELDTTVAVLSAVAGGVAPAVLSELAVADDVKLGRVRRVEIEGSPIVRPLTALWRGGADALHGASRLLVEIAAGGGR
ncbi:LysR family transcriptional regulator [Microbacterium horticulturae]|uniref:LysR family transcriptional regulator n=1 Tax=Microbacterium horticulturae TaxID=3028316 RepID=A0ABY8BYM8_9MICO|nr:LysR family transcriptional regulator [Microbacterium sp. KACC 23027]WEG09274.1 LysR family transcriptional regulator [Microbacterium sp. KACC 23027]